MTYKALQTWHSRISLTSSPLFIPQITQHTGLLTIPRIFQSSSCPTALSLALSSARSVFLYLNCTHTHTFGKIPLDTPFHLIFVLYSTYHQLTYWNVYLLISIIICLPIHPPLESKLSKGRHFCVSCSLFYCPRLENPQARSGCSIIILRTTWTNGWMNEWIGKQYILDKRLSSY